MTVEDGERSTVLDAMALLGGNEYLVQQMVEEGIGPNYSNYSNSLVKLNFLAHIQFIYQYFSNFTIRLNTESRGSSRPSTTRPRPPSSGPAWVTHGAVCPLTSLASLTCPSC